jgi:AraC family transcriptional activator of pobA
MSTVSALPLFHLYGDPPDDSAFDFIHIETISSRSSIHDWTIRAHRHRKSVSGVAHRERWLAKLSFETATARFLRSGLDLGAGDDCARFPLYTTGYGRLGR